MAAPILHNKGCNVKLQFYTGRFNDQFCEVMWVGEFISDANLYNVVWPAEGP